MYPTQMPSHPSQEATATARGRANPSIAVVIPAYRVAGGIVELLARFDASVSRIFVVDDCCPDGTGDVVRDMVRDPRVSVISNRRNLGVGGATAVGFLAALDAGAEIIVKLDGDGQHCPEWVPALVAPILLGTADMTKGNRFADFSACARAMPIGRLLANIALSIVSRPVTGYWNISDPANGLFAIHRNIVDRLPWQKIDSGYFFESDLLFRMGLMDAAIIQTPVKAIYAETDRNSGVRLWREAVPFALKCLRNFAERIWYRTCPAASPPGNTSASEERSFGDCGRRTGACSERRSMHDKTLDP